MQPCHWGSGFGLHNNLPITNRIKKEQKKGKRTRTFVVETKVLLPSVPSPLTSQLYEGCGALLFGLHP
jgi:hypothetical protein